LLFVIPARAQLVGIPQVNVPLPPAAEPPDRGPIGVFDRPRPELDPQGLRVSGMKVVPSLSVGPTYNSNVFATATNATADVLFVEHPALTVDSEPGLLSFMFSGYGDFVQYVNNGQLSNASGGALLGIRGDLAPTLLLESRTSLVYGHQDPASFATSITNGPVPYLPAYTVLSQTLSATREVGELAASLSGSFQRSTFQDVLIGGALLNQTQFNGNTYTVSPKVSYLISPPTWLYVQGIYQRTAYDSSALDSSSFAGVVGADLEIRRLIRGNVYAGYKDRLYDSSGSSSVSGFTYGLDLAWYPTEILTAKLSGKQDFVDAAVPGAGTSASVVNVKTIQGELDYEAARDVLVRAVVAYENDAYQSTTRIDHNLRIGATARYMLGPNAVIDLQYLYSMRRSSEVGFNYDRQQVSLSIKLQY
jgi:hypothetical protein